MIRITGTAAQIQRLQKLRSALKPQAIDRIVDRVAFETLGELVKATPKKWTGQTRKAWHVIRPEPGVRIVRNESKVMVFLERGTANEGTGYITPKTKKFLYIPLTRRAAGGWREGLVYGRDYVLAKRARGIKPRRIVAKQAPIAKAKLRAAMGAYLKEAVNG